MAEIVARGARGGVVCPRRPAPLPSDVAEHPAALAAAAPPAPLIGVQLCDLAVRDPVGRGEVIDVLEHELEVVLLGGLAQVARATPAQKRIVGRCPPALENLAGETVGGLVAGVHE